MQKNATCTFLLMDKHSIVKIGIKQILKDLLLKPVMYETSSIIEVVRIIKAIPIEILILDLVLQNNTAVDYIKMIKAINPNIKILVFTGLREEIYAVHFLRTGVDGFLSKTSSENEIKSAINCLLDTGMYISQKVNNQIFNHYIKNISINPLERLTQKEVEVARLVVKGYSNSRICSDMKLFKTTVSTHKKNIFEKVGVSNLVSLVEVISFYDINGWQE